MLYYGMDIAASVTWTSARSLRKLFLYQNPVVPFSRQELRTLLELMIRGVEREDFEVLLSEIYPKDFKEHNLSYRQWRSALHLSTCRGFASIRKLALKSINPPTPHDRLMFARTYAVDRWVLQALTALCERAKPLSLTKAQHVRIEGQAALAGKLPHDEGDSAPRASPENGAAKQETRSTTVASLVAPKREGEQVPKPFLGLPEAALQAAVDSAFPSFATKTTIPKQRPLAGKLGATKG
ncbi:hypothetical protein BJY52DRAFT_1209649 [Lactarius psammicola]|nr:hypothetical protein BJY52DRAFT_1209649 [Lactarius psammicola]